MRIALDYQTFTQQTYGGISRYFTRLVEGLAHKGDQVEVFAPLHINSYLESLPPILVNGRRIKQYPFKTVRLFTAFNYLIGYQKIAHWNPQVVHETYYSKARSAPASCPVVITVYDMIHELFDQEFSKRVDTAGAKKLSIQRADHVICISENTKKDLITLHGTREDKITVVHLGCDIETETETEIDAAAASRLSGDRPYLLYVGGRSGYKNFHRFLQAVSSSARLLSDFNLFAFGGGAFTSIEVAQIKSFGFSGRQVQQVAGSDALMRAFYAGATAFVYPSLYEGFGIPPLEAMAQRCPVICSNVSSMPEVAGNAAEYFSPLDVDSIRASIEAVVYSDSRSSALKALGEDRLQHFSWRKCVDKTRTVYQTLI